MPYGLVITKYTWPPVQRIGLDIAEDRVLCDPCAKAPSAPSGARPKAAPFQCQALQFLQISCSPASRRMTEEGSAEVMSVVTATARRPLKLLLFCRAIHTCKSTWEATMKTLGYARVSTRDQDLTGQIEALRAAGAGAIYREKISGARADRPELTKLMKVLAPGDVVLATKLDRLGRSTRELLELIERIGQAGAFFKSLGDPLFDTTTPTGRLLSTLLAAIAEFERELIREPTGEGRKRAKARGVRFGRPSVLTPHQRTEVLARLAEGDSCADIARSYNVDRSTISRIKPKLDKAAA